MVNRLVCQGKIHLSLVKQNRLLTITKGKEKRSDFSDLLTL